MQDAASPYHRVLATCGILLLTAGDFFRYLITWYGWGALVLVGLVLTVVELVRHRVDLRRLPLPLLAFFLLAGLSTIWSAYPGATALGVVVTAICTAFAVLLGALIPFGGLVDALSSASRWVIGGSFLFELIVALFVRHPVLPLWVAYCDPAHIKPACYWSRDLLLHGGRIQGIQGNANLLAMAALIGLIVFAIRLAARRGSRLGNGVWAVLALAAIALTRSSTIVVALAAVAVVAAFLLVAHRLDGRARLLLHGIGAAVLVVGAVLALVFRAPLLHLLGKSGTLTGRTDIWDIVIGLANQRPVAGWGWVSYWPNWLSFFQLFEKNGIRYYQAHDAWIDLYLQLGVLGVIVVALLALGALGRSWMLVLRSRPAAETALLDADTALAPASPVTWPLALAAPLLLVALLVQSLAESRLLIEIGWALFVALAIQLHPTRDRIATR
jgi:exopolysaccharide production protein ExoQ